MKPLSQSQHQALLGLDPVVRACARKLRARAPAPLADADLVGFGWVGAIDAVQRFDPAAGVELAAYATFRIRGAILDGIRQWMPVGCRRRPEYQREHVGGDFLKVNEVPVFDACPLAEAEDLEARLRPLTRVQAEVLRQRLLGRPLLDVGRDLGLCESRVSQIQSQALEELTGRRPGRGFAQMRRVAA